MSILQIKQTLKNGQSKTWKIHSKQKLVTLGTSRKAHLSSIDMDHSVYQAAFEYKNKKWSLLQFDTQVKNAQIELTDQFEIQLINSIFKFNIIEKQEFVSAQLNQFQSVGSLEKRIVLVQRGSKIIKTELLNAHQPYYYNFSGEKQKINFQSTAQWDTQEINDLQFKSKLIHVEDLTSMAHLNRDQVVDKDGRRLVLTTLGAMVLLLAVGLFSKKPAEIATVLPAQLSAQNIVFKTEPKQPKQKRSQGQKTEKKSVVATKTQDQNQPQQAAAPSANKVSALLKGAVGARISQLMGKVSATDARTANIIATSQGTKADAGPSGRALSAVGNVGASGRNWDGESVGASTGVSTNGIAGGRGVAALSAGLSAGKTGKGGIGLIEDESEVEGGLDREIIAQYIKSQLGKLLSCYDRQLAVNKDLGGKVAVKFIISGTGQVVQQNVTETEMKNLPTESCMLSHISKWKFPEPKGGTKVVVTYPFLFNTK
jgi:hypothetical protein